jgi:hypothetical protein
MAGGSDLADVIDATGVTLHVPALCDVEIVETVRSADARRSYGCIKP